MIDFNLKKKLLPILTEKNGIMIMPHPEVN